MNVKPNKTKAIFLAKRQMSEFVYDAVKLEGINFSHTEVEKLINGITIGGRKLSDQTITINQGNAWKSLFDLLENDQFSLQKETACSLHGIAAKEEALEWGQFRSGGVTIAGTDYLPPKADELNQYWENMLAQSEEISDIYDRAIFIFLSMARNQFFYDVNKRMGRFMMNGLLLANGYPAINLPASKQTEFNQLMLDFYPNGDCSAMTEFMKGCIDSKVVNIMNE